MDVCEMGSCMDILRRRDEKASVKGFSEDVILSILFPVLTGLIYLHKKQIVHRDIKVFLIFKSYLSLPKNNIFFF